MAFCISEHLVTKKLNFKTFFEEEDLEYQKITMLVSCQPDRYFLTISNATPNISNYAFLYIKPCVY